MLAVHMGPSWSPARKNLQAECLKSKTSATQIWIPTGCILLLSLSCYLVWDIGGYSENGRRVKSKDCSLSSYPPPPLVMRWWHQPLGKLNSCAGFFLCLQFPVWFLGTSPWLCPWSPNILRAPECHKPWGRFLLAFPKLCLQLCKKLLFK